MRILLPLFMSAALPCFAQDGAMPMLCAGSDPTWSMELLATGSSADGRSTADTAVIDYLYEGELDFALETLAEGADWPRAYTFVGRGGTAILVVAEPDDDTSSALPAMVFTQRGETPVLLVGVCDPIRN